jgi:osmotically-inducible protein OsmY
MSRNTSGPPRSYEEVVRKTVVDPDSSARPTLEQEQAAREGLRALDSDERALQDRVVRAVSSTGANAAGVTVEVSRELVTLRGRVADPAMLRAVEDAVARVPGVATIHSLIVVGSPGTLGSA